MQTTTVIDSTGDNLGKFDIPLDTVLAAYVTGSDGVPWTPAQLAKYPNAVLIDQAPANTPADELADVLDVEKGAATLDQIGPWVTAATHNYVTAARRGQRAPAIYMSVSSVTPVVNALVAAGITKGVNLWVAGPMTAAQAQAELNASGGPFPIIGIQYEFGPDHDVSLMSTDWLNEVSGKTPASAPGPGTQAGWKFCQKCQGLFWGPGEARSVCPVGTQHDGSNSHTYSLGYII